MTDAVVSAETPERRAEDCGFPAYTCRQCYILDGLRDRAEWEITRSGDVVVSWACNSHLADECHDMQRDWEKTRLIVTWTP